MSAPAFKSARRSERIPLSVPITIIGKDSSGRTFVENSRTLIVSRHGGLIATAYRLELGSQILIENPALSRTAAARVIWVGEGRFAGTYFEAGVEMDEAANIWPVEFPEPARSFAA